MCFSACNCTASLHSMFDDIIIKSTSVELSLGWKKHPKKLITITNSINCLSIHFNICCLLSGHTTQILRNTSKQVKWICLFKIYVSALKLFVERNTRKNVIALNDTFSSLTEKVLYALLGVISINMEEKIISSLTGHCGLRKHRNTI